MCAQNSTTRGKATVIRLTQSGDTALGDGRGTAQAAQRGCGQEGPRRREARGCGTRGKPHPAAPFPRRPRFTAGGTGAESGASGPAAGCTRQGRPTRPPLGTAAGPRTSRTPGPGEGRGACWPRHRRPGSYGESRRPGSPPALTMAAPAPRTGDRRAELAEGPGSSYSSGPAANPPPAAVKRRGAGRELRSPPRGGGAGRPGAGQSPAGRGVEAGGSVGAGA